MYLCVRAAGAAGVVVGAASADVVFNNGLVNTFSNSTN